MSNQRRCDHCGREMKHPEASVAYADGRRFDLCHPADGSPPDCYRLVTVYQEVIGSRKGAALPVPAASSPSRPAPRDAEQVIAREMARILGHHPALHPYHAQDAARFVAALSAAGYVIVRHDQGPSNVHWLDAYSDGAGSA